MEEIPDSERLRRRQQLVDFLMQTLRALGRNNEPFSGTPDYYNIVDSGLQEAEEHANRETE